MSEPLSPDVLAVLNAMREAGRTGANPAKLARAATAHLSDDDYEDLVLDLVDKELVHASRSARGSQAARYPTGITPRGLEALAAHDA